MEKFHIIFSDLPDPRDCTAQRDLTGMPFIALAASLCGAQSCAEMAEFGVAKEPLLREFLNREETSAAPEKTKYYAILPPCDIPP